MNIQNKIQHLRSLPKVGQASGIVNTDDKPYEASKAKKAGETMAEAYAEGVAGILETAFDSIKLTVFDKAAGFVTQMASQATKITKQFEYLNKTLGVNTQTSAKLTKQLITIANAGDKSSISFRDVGKSLQQMQTILPGVSQLLLEQAEAAVKQNESVGSALQLHSTMTKVLGVNEVSANQISQALLASGENTQTYADNLAAAASIQEAVTGETGVLRDMLEAVGQTSAATRLSFRGSFEELSKAALQANRLGTSLAQAEQNADNMLNIESSIGSELEFQQLTGKQILDDEGNSITNQIRLARLTGNTGEILKLQAEAIRSNYDSLKGDPLALKAFAQSMGMTTEQLAQQNEIIQARDKLTTKLTDEQNKELDSLLAEYDVSELTEVGSEANKQLQKIVGDNAAISKDIQGYIETVGNTLTVEERLTTALESLTAVIVNLSDPEGLIQGTNAIFGVTETIAGNKLDNNNKTTFTESLDGDDTTTLFNNVKKAIKPSSEDDNTTTLSNNVSDAIQKGTQAGLAQALEKGFAQAKFTVIVNGVPTTQNATLTVTT